MKRASTAIGSTSPVRDEDTADRRGRTASRLFLRLVLVLPGVLLWLLPYSGLNPYRIAPLTAMLAILGICFSSWVWFLHVGVLQKITVVAVNVSFWVIPFLA